MQLEKMGALGLLLLLLCSLEHSFGSLLLLDLVVVHLNHYLEVLERYSLIDPGSDPLWRLTFLINWEFQTSVILHLSIIHLLPLVIIK
jgi:hypothetical protein